MTLLGDRRGGVSVGLEAAPAEDGAVWITLVRRIGQADREAEADLARHFYDRVRVMASVRLHGSDAAFDIAQETILGAIEALRAGSLRVPGKLPAFVLSIARNIINDHLRRENRRRDVLLDPPGDPAASAVEFADDRRSLVREALKGLRKLDRQILLLTIVQGMTPREISPIVSLTPEAVRTRKARAMKSVARQVRKVTRKRFWNYIGTSGPRP